MDFILLVLFNFIFYSFIGWIIENIYCYFTQRRFQNDGFLYGPYKPMYGIAVSFLVGIAELFNSRSIMIILCFLIPTIVEYFSGYILKENFNKMYWDYSKLKYNLNGYICLEFSLYWTILSFIGIYYFHPLINKLYDNYLSFFSILIPILSIWFILDLFFTISLSEKKGLFKLIFNKAKI